MLSCIIIPGCGIFYAIIYQIFSPVRDWYRHITWLNIPQLELGNFQVIFPSFQNCTCGKNIWRIINTIASIWCENMLGYLSLDIICSSKLTVFLELRSENYELWGTDNVCREISQHIFAPHGGYCLYFMFACFIAGYWSQPGRSTYLLESRVHKTYGCGQGILQ